MTSRWLLNLFLLAAIGALGLIAYYEPGVEKPATAAKVTALTQNAIERIHVERRLQEPIELERQGPDWWIKGEPTLPADAFQVRALARLAGQTATRSYPAGSLDLAQLQLDPPAASVVFNQTRVDLGTLDALESLRYVRVDDQVHLIPDLYEHLIEAGVTQFIRRRLFREGQRITAIALPGFSLHQADGAWTDAHGKPIAAGQAQPFIERWQEAAALNVRKAEPGAAGDTVSVELREPEQAVTLVIRSREPELVLVRPDYGIEYRLGDRSKEFLQLPAANDADATPSAAATAPSDAP